MNQPAMKASEPKASAAMVRLSEAYVHMHSALLDPSRTCLCEPQQALKELYIATVALLIECHEQRETCKAYGIKVAE